MSRLTNYFKDVKTEMRHVSWPTKRQALVFTGLLLSFSPTLHPWYVLWLLPFAALTISRPWLLLSATSLISYEVYGRATATGLWHENVWLRLPEFLLPLGLWIWLLWRDGRRIADPEA